MPGPLEGLRIVEFRGLGPVPFAGMLLSDMGAEVIRIDRAEAVGPGQPDVLGRNRRSIALDLKKPEATEVALELVASADGLLEGFRPGAMERLGLGPDVCLERNPRLVYGRMTGWGQTGPYAKSAGHDLNYIALTGALAAIGRKDGPPEIPLAFVGDFGGGGMMLAFGMLAALFESARSGTGQVVDAAIVDGVALLMTTFTSNYSLGRWSLTRGTNLVDSGRHFYDVYRCSDGEYVSVGSIEPVFYARLLAALGLDDIDPADQHDLSQDPAVRERLTELFATKPRDEWVRLLEGADACFAPVLSMAEAPQHPHNAARGTFTEVGGLLQGSVAPRLSRTPGEIVRPPAKAGADSDALLDELGRTPEQIAALRAAGAVA
ncbi:MAG: CoA transferase [Actinomycetota bacterium]|nr:MAG: CoA transferase [Actinomycetota bacterium]